MDAEALYIQLGRLVEQMPELNVEDGEVPSETMTWLARAHALVSQTGDISDALSLKMTTSKLFSVAWSTRQVAAQEIGMIVRRALANTEIKAPISAQGSFIAAGNAFDALGALMKVLASATVDLLIVDPYLDARALTDFGALGAEGISLRLLTDQHTLKPSLLPAAVAWATQYGTVRPLQVRTAPPRSLHDRVILVDASQAWILTQSLNAFATRAPASIVRVDPETSALKVAAYQQMWEAAGVLV